MVYLEQSCSSVSKKYIVSLDIWIHSLTHWMNRGSVIFHVSIITSNHSKFSTPHGHFIPVQSGIISFGGSRNACVGIKYHNLIDCIGAPVTMCFIKLMVSKAHKKHSPITILEGAKPFLCLICKLMGIHSMHFLNQQSYHAVTQTSINN